MIPENYELLKMTFHFVLLADFKKEQLKYIKVLV